MTDITIDRPAVTRIARLARQRDGRNPEQLTADDFALVLPAYAETQTYQHRELYLAWAAAWKADYAALRDEIRSAKRAARDLARAGDPNAGREQAQAVRLGSTARALLALRRVSKADSWARREAARAANRAAFNSPVNDYEQRWGSQWPPIRRDQASGELDLTPIRERIADPRSGPVGDPVHVLPGWDLVSTLCDEIERLRGAEVR